jgi:hypothetical protein
VGELNAGKKREAGTGNGDSGDSLTNPELWDYCWSTARFHLSLSSDEFFCLTPRQFHLLTEKHREAIQHREFLTGMALATFANHSISPPKKALGPLDFFPSLDVRKQKADRQLLRDLVDSQIRGFIERRYQAQEETLKHKT